MRGWTHACMCSLGINFAYNLRKRVNERKWCQFIYRNNSKNYSCLVFVFANTVTIFIFLFVFVLIDPKQTPKVVGDKRETFRLGQLHHQHL